MIDAGGIGNNERRSRVLFRFFQSTDQLIGIGTHGDLCHVYVIVSHGNTAKVFLCRGFSGIGKLCDCTDGSGFGRLSARVGINFRIHNNDIDIDSGSEDMIQSAVADIVCPAVTAVHPHALFHQRIRSVFQELDIFIIFPGSCQGAFDRFGNGPCLLRIVTLLKPLHQCIFQGLIRRVLDDCPGMGLGLRAHLFYAQTHSQTVFRIVFKQRVGWGRTAAGLHLCIREGGR